MVRSAELAERLDVRLHTHFAENAEDDEYSLATFGCRPTEYLERTGWLTDRAWLAHCVMPERRRGRAASAPPASAWPTARRATSSWPRASPRSSTCGPPASPSGSASTGRRRPTPASLWLEARQAMLLAKLRDGAGGGHGPHGAGDGDAAAAPPASGATGELGVLAPGAVGDVAVWPLDRSGVRRRHRRPVEAWLRCGPVGARDTVVHGVPVVRDGRLVHAGLDDRLRDHRRVAERLQRG